MVEPPIFPSINLPTQVLPEPPNLPRAVLEIPRAEAPSYIPMLALPSELRPPVGVAEEGEVKEEEKNEPPPPPEIQTITIPWIDHELPVPKEEIVVAAGMTAVVSVVATLKIDTTPSPTSSVTFSSTTVDRLAGGFKIRHASTNNVAGTTYYWLATKDRAFKYANAQIN